MRCVGASPLPERSQTLPRVPTLPVSLATSSTAHCSEWQLLPPASRPLRLRPQPVPSAKAPFALCPPPCLCFCRAQRPPIGRRRPSLFYAPQGMPLQWHLVWDLMLVVEASLLGTGP